MSNLTSLEFEVLTATMDDVESLEQIYSLLALEFSAENYRPSDPNAFYLRRAKDAPVLEEIADAITKLMAQGLLAARREDGSHVTGLDELSIVWKGWFYPTEQGRELLQDFSRHSRSIGGVPPLGDPSD